MARRTILITGGAGFIGSHFLLFLYRNHPDYKFFVLDALTYAGNPQNFPEVLKKDTEHFSFWYGDINNSDLVDSLVSQSDMVLHFAAETHVARSIFDNRVFFMTDVLGTQMIANAVLKNHRKVERFIHISSSEVYGTAMTEPMTEGHPLNPLSPYAAAKAGADRLVFSYVATYGIPAAILRPFNTYGSHQHLEKAIPRFITSAILNEPLTVHGAGSACRDWVYVEDVCEAIDSALHCDLARVQGEAINIGTGSPMNILSIARLTLKKLGKPPDLITYIGDRPGQVSRHIASTDKAERLLGWKAKTSFEKGLDLTIEWYRKNQAWWEPLLWMRHVPILTKEGKVEMH